MTDDYGRRLIPVVLHNEAKANPQRTFAILARSSDITDGFDRITFRQVARAANYVAKWLQDEFECGIQPIGFPTLAYVGGPDLSYSIVCYATMQCRYKVFLLSPRNTTATNASLLEQTQCTKFLYADQAASAIQALQVDLPNTRFRKLPSLEELLSKPDSKYDYNYDFDYDQVFRDPVIVLHSSGSTGIPKPITFTHGTLATWDVRDWPTIPGRDNHDSLTTLRLTRNNCQFYDIFPLFHLAGFVRKVLAPVYILAVPIIGPSSRPPSGALAAEIIRASGAYGAVLPPSIVEQLYKEPDSDALFQHLDFLLYAGGPLPEAVGSDVSKLTKLCQMYGSTEIGQLRQLAPYPDDWAYLEFHPHERFEFQEAADGLYELVIQSGSELQRTSALYNNFPDIKEFRTRDLFEPHPSKSGLWKFKARNDDILVFSSGEKLNPIPFELSITSNSGISGALIVGHGHQQSALLVELVSHTKEVGQDVWQAIETANTLLPQYGRVLRSMVVVASAGKPFARAGKGTVIRGDTEKLYATEIEHLYLQYESRHTPKLTPVVDSSVFQSEDVKALLRSVLEQVSLISSIPDDANLYEDGMDSITTAEALGHLRTSLHARRPDADLSWLMLETFYSNPTINQFTAKLLLFLNEGQMQTNSNRVAEMEAKITKYTQDLPSVSEPLRFDSGQKSWNIAITGTTGFLGTRLLTQLVTSSEVSRIYCLNRSPAAQTRFEKLGIVHEKETTFMRIDFSSPRLGLETGDYLRLTEQCDLIIHNAWRVDFNLSLNSFDDHLLATRHLIDLSAASSIRPRILFISSITSTGVWTPEGSPREVVPEAIVPDLSTAIERGYGQAKRVAEHVLAVAASRSKIPVSIVRIGQISPGEDNIWPKDDIVPVFLKTCKESGRLASDFVDRIDWIPVHWAAQVVLDVVRHDLASNELPALQVYNLVNPKHTSWSTVVDLMQAWCGNSLKAMSMQEWVDELKKEDENDAIQLARFPALRMLKSFEQMACSGPYHDYAMNNLLAVAGDSMNSFGAVSVDQLKSWFKELFHNEEKSG